MSGLGDIQLQIVIDVMGLDSMQKLNNLTSQFGKTGQTVAEQQRRYTDAINKSSHATHSFSDAMNEAELRLDAVWRAGYRLIALGDSLRNFGKDIIGIGLDAASAWGDYEFVLDKVAASAGIFNTQSALYGKLSQAIQQASVDLEFLPIDDVTEAFYYWITATGQEIKSQKDLRIAVAGVEAAVKTGIITQTDYASAIKGAYLITQAFHKPLSAIPKVLAQLHVETIRTSAEFNDLISAYSYMGPLANQLGIKFETMTGILGRLNDLGIRASRSGRGLGMVMTILVRPTEKERNALNRLFKEQLHVADGWDKVVFKHGKFQGMEKLITNLAKATMGLTDQQRINYLTTIFGTQNAARTILPLISAQIDALKKGNSIWKDSKYSVEGATKAWMRQWDLVSKSWKGLTGRLQRGFEVLKLLFGAEVAKVMAPFLDKANDLLDTIRAWVSEHKKLVDSFVRIGAIVGVLLTIAGTVFIVIGSFIALGAGMIFISNMAVEVVAHFGKLVSGLLLWAAVISGVAVLVARNTGGILDAFKHLWTSVSPIVEAIVKKAEEFRKELIVNIGQKTAPFVERAFKKIADIVNSLADHITQFVNKIGKDKLNEYIDIAGKFLGVMLLWSSIVPILLAVGGAAKVASVGLGLMFDAVKLLTGFNLVAGSLKGLVGLLINIATALGPVGLLIVGVIAVIAGAIIAYETNFMGFKDFVDGIVNWVLGVAIPAIQSFVGQVGNFVSDVVTTIQSGLQTLVANVQTALAPLASAIQGFINTWAPVFQKVGETTLDVFNNQIMPAFNGFMSMLNEHLVPLLQEVGGWFETIFNFIGGVIGTFLNLSTTVLNALIGLFTSIFGGIVDLISTDISVITNVISAFLGWVAPIVGGTLDFLIRAFGTAFSGILNVVSSILGAIFDAIRGAMENIRGVVGIFLGIIHGNFSEVWNGILGIIKGVWDAITGAIGGAIGVVTGIITTGLNGILGIFEFIFGSKPGSILAGIQHFLSDILGFGGDIISNLANGIWKAISWGITSIVDSVGRIIRGLGNSITSAGGGLFNAVINIGKDIVRGIWKGVQDLIGWLANNIANMIQNVIPGPIKDALGISSPSKVTAELGRYVMMGLAKGINDSTALAVAAMQNSTMQVAAAAQSGTGSINAAIGSATGDFSSSLSISGTNTRVIKLQVDVTSSDGSVERVDIERLADLIKGPELVDALAHMATVND